MPGKPTKEARRAAFDTVTDYAQRGQSLAIPALPPNMLVPVLRPADTSEDFQVWEDFQAATARPTVLATSKRWPLRSPLVPALAILSLLIAGALALVPATLPSVAPLASAGAAGHGAAPIVLTDPRAYQALQTAFAALKRVKSVEQALANIRVQEAANLVLTLPDVSFPSGETALNPAFKRQLAPLIDYLKANPQRIVIVKGYTDDTGPHVDNLLLSNKRAEAVKDYLVDKGAVAGRILTVGYGEADPVVTNDTPAGRKENRRVEIVLVDARTAAR